MSEELGVTEAMRILALIREEPAWALSRVQRCAELEATIQRLERERDETQETLEDWLRRYQDLTRRHEGLVKAIRAHRSAKKYTHELAFDANIALYAALADQPNQEGDDGAGGR